MDVTVAETEGIEYEDAREERADEVGLGIRLEIEEDE